MADERLLLSLKDPTKWPDAYIGEVPDEFAGRNLSRENLEARREQEASDWNAWVDILAPKPNEP